MARVSKHESFLQIAETIALRGTCSQRKVGCVLVDKHSRILSTGYNGVASGLPHCNEGHPCPGAAAPSGTQLDDCGAIHAEQNAILLLSDPWAVEAAYVTVSPCMSCMKLLLGTSCETIYTRSIYPDSRALDLWASAGRKLEAI